MLWFEQYYNCNVLFYLERICECSSLLSFARAADRAVASQQTYALGIAPTSSHTAASYLCCGAPRRFQHRLLWWWTLLVASSWGCEYSCKRSWHLRWPIHNTWGSDPQNNVRSSGFRQTSHSISRYSRTLSFRTESDRSVLASFMRSTLVKVGEAVKNVIGLQQRKLPNSIAWSFALSAGPFRITWGIHTEWRFMFWNVRFNGGGVCDDIWREVYLLGSPSLGILVIFYLEQL